MSHADKIILVFPNTLVIFNLQFQSQETLAIKHSQHRKDNQIEITTTLPVKPSIPPKIVSNQDQTIRQKYRCTYMENHPSLLPGTALTDYHSYRIR